jgi:hypothetical protein
MKCCGKREMTDDGPLDWQIDWSDWLDTDTIAASTWTIEANETPIALEVTNVPDPPSFTDTITKVWLEGGTDGVQYKVVNKVTTAAGRSQSRYFLLKVKDSISACG